MRVHRALRVVSSHRRGSSRPVVVETAEGLFLTKLRGAAQGTAPLVAEIVVAALADALGLRVPRRALISLDTELKTTDRDPELTDLLAASRGINLGFRFLERASEIRKDQVEAASDELACSVLWLDALVLNPDRTPRNPNILFSERQAWLVDHGAALPFHYAWRSVTEDFPRSALRRAGIPAERLLAFQRELLERIRAVPGVSAAAEAGIVPVSGASWNERVILRGIPQKTFPNFNRVTPGFFETMSTRLLAGRDFDERDTLAGPRVAVVNQSFARRILHRENPVGESFEVEAEPGKPTPSYQIVGLVRDSKYRDLREDFGPIAFLPAAQETAPDPFAQLLIRSDAPLASLTTSLKRATFEQSPGIAITFQTLSRQVSDSLLRERLMATLSGFFGGLAGLLATVGLYGVMSYRVACRRNEIGIRMAVGADRRDIVGMILREAAVMLGVGLLAGAVVALLVGHAASALLFGLTASDPATLAMAALALAIVAALASYLPAARAARLDPTAALRE